MRVQAKHMRTLHDVDGDKGRAQIAEALNSTAIWHREADAKAAKFS